MFSAIMCRLRVVDFSQISGFHFSELIVWNIADGLKNFVLKLI